jgi:PAS domain S-box-containing protein
MDLQEATDGLEIKVAALVQTLKAALILFPIVLFMLLLLWWFGYQLNIPVLGVLLLSGLAVIGLHIFLLEKRWLLSWSNNFGFFFMISVPIAISLYFTGGLISPFIWLLIFVVLFQSMSYGLAKGLISAAIYVAFLWAMEGLVYFQALPAIAVFPGVSPAASAQLSVLVLCGHTMLLLISPLTVGILSQQLRQSERELREEQQKLSLMLDASPIIVFYKDKAGRFIRVNRAFAAALKMPEKDFVGKTVFDLYSRPIAQGMTDDDREVIGSGRPKLDIVESYEAADGVRWVRTDKVPVRGGDGQVSGLIGFAIDISELKQMDEKLRQNRAQLTNAVKIAHLGPWEYDVLKDRFTFNDAFYSIFHTTAAAAGGYTMSSADYAKKFVHPDDAAMVGSAVSKAITTVDPDFTYQVDHRIIYADGGTGYVSVRFFVVKDEQGRTIGTYGVSQDITERKRVEEELKKKVEELETFYKASMDREDKILELKKKIEELEKHV